MEIEGYLVSEFREKPYLIIFSGFRDDMVVKTYFCTSLGKRLLLI